MKWAFIFAVALTVAADDSPLVQASKDAKKPKDKPAPVVITNATVKQSKAKLSTTKSQRALPKAETKKAAANDCSAAPLAPAPVAAAPRPEMPMMDDAELYAYFDSLQSTPTVKPPPNMSSAPQFSPNTSAPQSSQKP